MSNAAMQDRLVRLPGEDAELPEALSELVQGGLVMRDGHLLLTGAEGTGPSREECFDATGFEALTNHVHVDAEDTRDLGDLHVARTFAEHIGSMLLTESLPVVGRVILSRDEGDSPNSIVRLHRLRPSETWLSPDLESYIEPVAYWDVA